MSVPQMKEGPASMLRAMFAGIGSLLSVIDKVRPKPAAEAPADAQAPAPADATPQATAPETTTAAETAAEPAAAAPEPVAVTEPTVEADVVVVEATATPEAAAEPEAVVAEETVAETPAEETVAEAVAEAVAEVETPAEAAADLPIANYDELTVASLRARLRNLSNDDLNQLMTYEQAHQNRPEVIKMFQNRLIKMTSSMPKLEA